MTMDTQNSPLARMSIAQAAGVIPVVELIQQEPQTYVHGEGSRYAMRAIAACLFLCGQERQFTDTNAPDELSKLIIEGLKDGNPDVVEGFVERIRQLNSKRERSAGPIEIDTGDGTIKFVSQPDAASIKDRAELGIDFAVNLHAALDNGLESALDFIEANNEECGKEENFQHALRILSAGMFMAGLTKDDADDQLETLSPDELSDWVRGVHVPQSIFMEFSCEEMATMIRGKLMERRLKL
ncbi:MAG: hypothetical protein AB7G06_05880 [Bdellovibrionales bacterium]